MSITAVGWLAVAFLVASYLKSCQKLSMPLSFAGYSLLLYQLYYLAAFNLMFLYIAGFLWNTIRIIKIIDVPEIKSNDEETKRNDEG